MSIYRPRSFFRRFPFGLLVLTAAALMPQGLSAQETNRKTAVDLVYKSPTWLARVRLYDITMPAGKRQWNLMLGRRWGAWNTYLYWKADNRDRSWLGARGDTRVDVWKNRLSTGLEGRVFLGLKRGSARHGYLLTSLLYNLDSEEKIRAGLQSQGIVTEGADAALYIGPCLYLKINRRITARISYGPDWLGAGGLLYMKLYLYL